MKLEIELKHNGVHEANIKFDDSPRTNARGRVRGHRQIFEAEDKILASRTAWPRGSRTAWRKTTIEGSVLLGIAYQKLLQITLSVFFGT